MKKINTEALLEHTQKMVDEITQEFLGSAITNHTIEHYKAAIIRILETTQTEYGLKILPLGAVAAVVKDIKVAQSDDPTAINVEFEFDGDETRRINDPAVLLTSDNPDLRRLGKQQMELERDSVHLSERIRE